MVLKIRRRKFQRTPQKGEIVITRRLFRTGESEYLLNGKLCRLRDIQDIFMGTGLGPESYAIIGQERIGQLLSSKPHDRRAIIEEAAGITRFKTKKRLAELRLESAKQNLARVDDIFEEVTRQMNSLKRQAAKAERFAAVRDELRGRLRVVLASRMAADGCRPGSSGAGDRRPDRTHQRIGGEIGSRKPASTAHRARLRARPRGPGGAEPSQQRRRRTGARHGPRAQQHRARRRTGSPHRRRGRRTRTDPHPACRHRGRTHPAAQLSWSLPQARPRAFRQKVEARQQEARTAAEEVFGAERHWRPAAATPCICSPWPAMRATTPPRAKRALQLWSAKPSGSSRNGPGTQRIGKISASRVARPRCALSPPPSLKRLEGEIAALRE